MIKAIDRLPGKKTMTITLPLLFLLLLQIINKTFFCQLNEKCLVIILQSASFNTSKAFRTSGGVKATKKYKGYLSNYKQSSFEFKAISSGK